MTFLGCRWQENHDEKGACDWQDTFDEVKPLPRFPAMLPTEVLFDSICKEAIERTSQSRRGKEYCASCGQLAVNVPERKV